MADSKDNKSGSTNDEVADDLDAILNDLDPSNEDKDDLIDDEDAIDRLLMDDAFDVEQAGNEKLEEDNKKANAESQDQQIDEFAENEQSDSSADDTGSINNKKEIKPKDDIDEFDVDERVDSNINEDEFAEIDDPSEDEGSSETSEQKEETVSEEIAENDDELGEDRIDPELSSQLDDDFLMSDFDISADDEFDLTNDSAEDIDDVSDAVNEEESKEEKTIIVSSNTNDNIEKNNAALAEITIQISQLCLENETLKQKIIELTPSTDKKDSITEELESLQKEQRKLRKTIKENESKVPIITYVAIGIATIALLVGGGLGAIGYGAQSDVTELNELVLTLEEEIELLSTKDASREIIKINENMNLLAAKDDHTDNEINLIKKSIQTDALNSRIEDLVNKNDQAQVAIEQLLAKVESLEKRKVVSTVRKKPKKVVPKVMWVVNLVSFRQEWYAKRKAAEFEKKAVPAEVIKVKVKGENWFRLRVKGFKTKYEAAAYAVKVKKALNLSSVWVTKA